MCYCLRENCFWLYICVHKLTSWRFFFQYTRSPAATVVCYTCYEFTIQSVLCTISSQKYALHYFKAIFNLSCACTHTLPYDVMLAVDNHNNSSDLLEEQPEVLLNKYYGEISSACYVDTKPRGIEASCIISGDRGQPT